MSCEEFVIEKVKQLEETNSKLYAELNNVNATNTKLYDILYALRTLMSVNKSSYDGKLYVSIDNVYSEVEKYSVDDIIRIFTLDNPFADNATEAASEE